MKKIRIERIEKKRAVKPSTQEEKDEIFGGYEELNRLAKGIYEEDEEDEDKDSIADVIPDNWGELMSNDRRVRDSFRIKITEAREKKSKKKKIMPHCRKDGSNPYHSGETGEFTSRDKAASWSIRHPKTSKDCKAGLARMSGGRELFHKHSQECGREGEWLCGEKDKKKREKTRNEILIEGEAFELEAEHVDELSKRLQSIQDRSPEFLQSLRYLIAPLVTAADASNMSSVSSPSKGDVKEAKPRTDKNSRLTHMDAGQIRKLSLIHI